MSREWTRRSIEELVKEYAIKNGYAGGGESDFKEVEYPYVVQDGNELVSCSDRFTKRGTVVYESYFVEFSDYVDTILIMKQLIEDGYVPPKVLISAVPQNMSNVGKNIPYNYCYKSGYDTSIPNSFICFYLPDGETIDGKKFYRTDMYTLIQNGVPYTENRTIQYIDYTSVPVDEYKDSVGGTGTTNVSLAYLDMNVIYRIFFAVLDFITLKLKEIDPEYDPEIDRFPTYSKITFYMGYTYDPTYSTPFPKTIAFGYDTWDDVPLYTTDPYYDQPTE